MIIEVTSESQMKQLAARIGAQLEGGEVFELVGDIGAGKTTFTKGLALGLAVDDDVQSPSFTISRMYEARDGIQLAHYDFYRLEDAGIMASEIAELVNDPTSITVVEWAGIVDGVLPEDRIRIAITAPSETVRLVDITGFEGDIAA